MNSIERSIKMTLCIDHLIKKLIEDKYLSGKISC